MKTVRFLILHKFIILALIHFVKSEPLKSSSTLLCAYYVAPGGNSTDNDDQEISFSDDDPKSMVPYIIHQEVGVVECSNQTYCFTVWKTDENGTDIYKRRGCLDKSPNLEVCEQKTCSADVKKGLHGDHRFCCCTDNMCNVNVAIVNSESNSTFPPPHEKMVIHPVYLLIWQSPIVWLCCSLTMLLLLAAILIFWYGSPRKQEPEQAPLAPSGPGYSSNLRNVDNLKLCAMIGQGKYGTVWKGMINEQTVAVKIFPAQHKQYFLNEKDIYSGQLMDHPNLLEYYGCDERRTLDDSIEYLLVLSLAPLGCLQDWLKENTSSFSVFIQMAKSVARGLAHMHTEMIQGDLRKPCICHRDLNSRNVLVKADLTCCIADFGFAMKMFGPRYEWKGELTLAETKSINEVGTMRYLSPEVLEGAVNLRDCESSLKQVDVYALGLILWELCVRCHDWYPPAQTPPSYKMPYESEIGKHPSYDQVQVLVARHKARPLFPPGWGGGPAAKIAKETCEDCWDHDAEARLTSLCAEERIHEMSNLPPRPRNYNSISPPLSTNNLISPVNPGQNSGTSTSNACNKNIVGILKTTKRQKLYETTDPAMLNLVSPTSLKNREIFSQQIQPFQGRNPCMERNLAPLNTQNQVLIEKSQKHSFVPHNETYDLSRIEDDVSVEDLISNTIHNRGTGQHILGQGFPKQNNVDRKLNGWYGVRALIQKKLFKRHPYALQDEIEEKTSNLDSENRRTVMIDIESESSITGAHWNSNSSEPATRPTNLDLAPKINIDRSYDHHSSAQKSINSDENTKSMYKTPPGSSDEQFAIVMNDCGRIRTSKSASAVKSLNNFEMFDERNLKRQRSLEVFRDVFGTKGSIERLRDPSQRVKTPGDVPPSVRKVRASKTLSLYDDRMMDISTAGNAL